MFRSAPNVHFYNDVLLLFMYTILAAVPLREHMNQYLYMDIEYALGYTHDYYVHMHVQLLILEPHLCYKVMLVSVRHT